MLTVSNLNVGYTQKPVLQHLNFTLPAGQSVCLLGQNGAGKTTFFRAILNTIAYQGQITIAGADTKKLARAELAKKVAYIPQNHDAPAHFSVFEMVLMGTTANLKPFQQPGKKEEKRAIAALERLGIRYLQHDYFGEISGGEQQLVTVARSVAQNSRVILMDEPCANLDFGNQMMVLEMARELARQGFLIIQSTHEPNHALNFADQILLLENQQMTLGSPEKLLTGPSLSCLYQFPVKVVAVTVDGQQQRFCVAARKELKHVANL